jgi:ribosomal protein S18 acetylase RimI-like enzyme
MTFTQRPFRGAADLPAIAELINLLPEHHHIIDYPYRLASPSIHALGNVGLWEDASGALMGCAIIQRQFWCADWYVHPAAQAGELPELMWAWADAHLRQVGDEQGKPFYFIFDARDDDPAQRALWERHGLKTDTWHYLHMARSLAEPIPPAELPDGYAIRPLRSDEAAAYAELHRTAFGTKNMTAEWRERTLGMPEYRQDIDLVVEAPDGRLAAFCILWLSQRDDLTGMGRVGQVEPLGTHPDFRKLGLAQALLLEGFRRLKAAGADTALVEVDAENDPGHSLYQSVGFRRQYAVLKYSAYFGGPPA